jgi:hypothetical protein
MENLTTAIVFGEPNWTSDETYVFPQESLLRPVELTGDEWLIVSQCLENFADVYRKNQSLIIATYVTRGQTAEAVSEATKMNQMLQRLDQIQAKVV